MPIRKFKPTSDGRRHMTVVVFDEITTATPHKPLTRGKKQNAGRNNKGRVTCRHRGGGHKRRYRIIDFKRNKDGIPARVETIEYDPNRSAWIALVCYRDGERRYVLAPHGLKVGGTLMSGPEADIRLGNALPLRNIPLGTMIHNIELYPGQGGQLVRGAGTGAQLMAKEGKYANVRLPSGEVRLIHLNCRATIGQLSNLDRSNITEGKAGRQRWRGRRPTVSGNAMNPVDHPHGGGEGHASVGMPTPKTRWGKPARGVKTRARRKTSDAHIVRSRRK